MITVAKLAPFNQWDQNILDRLFTNTLYPTGFNFRTVEGYPTNVDGCVLVIPGRYWHERCYSISEAVAKFEWVLAIRTGDEEDLLDPYQVYHPNIRWWVQTPHPGGDYDGRVFGVGFPPHFNELRDRPREFEVVLSAQNTHPQRQQCFDALDELDVGKRVEKTEGFTQGLRPADYADLMCSGRVAPCPSGPVTADSFRLYEALEAHCVPIADDVSPKWDRQGFWRTVFPDAPFPILDSYEQLPGYIHDQLELWPANANHITVWWMRQKRAMSRWLREDLEALGAL